GSRLSPPKRGELALTCSLVLHYQYARFDRRSSRPLADYRRQGQAPATTSTARNLDAYLCGECRSKRPRLGVGSPEPQGDMACSPSSAVRLRAAPLAAGKRYRSSC